MDVLSAVSVVLGCILLQQPFVECVPRGLAGNNQIDDTFEQRVVREGPLFSEQSIDVVITARTALVWDIESGAVLYARKERERRPVASLSKLLSALAVVSKLNLEQVEEIPREAAVVQRLGSHIKLPQGHHAKVKDLLAASLVASANDAMVALAVATSGSEKQFVDFVNQYALSLGLVDTKLVNSTGLAGEGQYSTASDIRILLSAIYQHPSLAEFTARPKGVLMTEEGAKRPYKTTNELLETYMPILAGKTGYTHESGENVAIITQDNNGHKIGAVILGSTQRFQDMKILVEWIWRHYAWK